MAEWLGTGLQNLLPRFNSGRRLQVQSRALSSAGERFPDTEEVTGSIPVGPTPEDPPFPLGVFGRSDPSCGERLCRARKRSLVQSQ